MLQGSLRKKISKPSVILRRLPRLYNIVTSYLAACALIYEYQGRLLLLYGLILDYVRIQGSHHKRRAVQLQCPFLLKTGHLPQMNSLCLVVSSPAAKMQVVKLSSAL